MKMLLAKTAAAPTAKNGFIFTILGSKWGVLWLWLLLINALALLVYGLDKILAAWVHGLPWSCSVTKLSIVLFGSACPCSP